MNRAELEAQLADLKKVKAETPYTNWKAQNRLKLMIRNIELQLLKD